MIAAIGILRRFWWAPVILALAAIVWWVAGLRSTITEQQAEITSVKQDLEAEQLARRKDVAGLTALSQGLTAAAVDTKADHAILERTIDASNPTPASPALSNLIAELRAADGSQHAPAP